jgi:hypothetical protein
MTQNLGSASEWHVFVLAVFLRDTSVRARVYSRLKCIPKLVILPSPRRGRLVVARRFNGGKADRRKTSPRQGTAEVKV